MQIQIILLLTTSLTISASKSTTAQDTSHDTSLQGRQDTSHHYKMTHDEKHWDYIMMKNGQMIEVTNRVKSPVTHNIVLVNETTIHPDGTINDLNGKTKHLSEGKYITMDGRIRNLADLPAGLPSH